MKEKNIFNFNMDINGIFFPDVAETIGSIFGEGGRSIGKMVDNMTKDTTIKIDTRTQPEVKIFNEEV